jgi:hypothetical protein
MMIRSVKAIVREPKWPALPAGTLLLVSHLAFEADAQQRFFPASLPKPPTGIYRVSPENLLPYSSFLRRQPTSEFWILVFKQTLVSEGRMEFLSDAKKQNSGPNPFRFESLGEVLYYMVEYRLDPQKFKLCCVGHINFAPGSYATEVGDQTNPGGVAEAIREAIARIRPH